MTEIQIVPETNCDRAETMMSSDNLRNDRDAGSCSDCSVVLSLLIAMSNLRIKMNSRLLKCFQISPLLEQIMISNNATSSFPYAGNGD